MSTQMLYTKYRPSSLDEMLDQEVVVKTLKNTAAKGEVAHAYLFTGSRGIGKTSVARAFARELSIAAEDIYEIDAASHAGVGDIKELSETFYTLPLYSKYKMYILDEVHMFSNNAFNAFLKNLEEPPAHVIFVLATTDIQKLPETIISRCIVLTLKKPKLEVLEKQLENISDKENLIIDKESIKMIALSGNGSYRDTLANLQKIISFCGSNNIKIEDTQKVLNTPSFADVFSFLKTLDGLEAKEKGLEILKNIQNNNYNLNFFSENVLSLGRVILLLRFKSMSLGEVFEKYGEYAKVQMEEILNNKTPKMNSKVILSLIDAQRNTQNTNLATLPFELMLLE